jgi:hypothetical protein
LRIPINSRGELLGLTINGTRVCVYKQSEIELVDLESGDQRIIPADVSSRKGIIHTPYGDIWCGDRAIYILEPQSQSWELLNQQWINMYDGTIEVSANLPYITSAYRSAIVAGYDEYTDVAWFQIQTNKASGSEYLCYRYSFRQKKWYVPRRVGSTQAKFLISKPDKTFTIGHSAGALRYPFKDDANGHRYQDAVPYGDGSAGTGIETRLDMVLGSVTGMHGQVTLFDSLIDIEGKSYDGTGKYQVDVYANEETTAFATRTLPVDSRPRRQLFPPRGLLSRIRMRLSLPTATITNFGKFLIRTVESGIVPHQRLGGK